MKHAAPSPARPSWNPSPSTVNPSEPSLPDIVFIEKEFDQSVLDRIQFTITPQETWSTVAKDVFIPERTAPLVQSKPHIMFEAFKDGLYSFSGNGWFKEEGKENSEHTAWVTLWQSHPDVCGGKSSSLCEVMCEVQRPFTISVSNVYLKGGTEVWATVRHDARNKNIWLDYYRLAAIEQVVHASLRPYKQ